MTSAAIVTLGQAIAMIPTMTLDTPSRISEVDDDLNMTGIPFFRLSFRAAWGGPGGHRWLFAEETRPAPLALSATSVRSVGTDRPGDARCRRIRSFGSINPR